MQIFMVFFEGVAFILLIHIFNRLRWWKLVLLECVKQTNPKGKTQLLKAQILSKVIQYCKNY